MELHNLQSVGLLRRLAACVYDWLLIIALMMVASLPFVVPADQPVNPGNTLYQLFLVSVVWAFFVGFWAYRGQTPGMRAWRLHLISADGQPVTLAQASLRLVAAGISVFAAGLGFLWQLADSNQLAWHDRWSATRLMVSPAKN